MTLTKKLSYWIMGGLALIFLSVAVTTFCIEREYYRLQLERSARNIEVSLGVVLAQPLKAKDNQLIASMASQIFDQGVFYSLQVRGAHNEIVASQNKGTQHDTAPLWFMNLVRWPTVLRSITVTCDQTLVGRLVVSVDPHYAYNALWNSFLVLLYWCFFWFVVSLLAVYFFVRWLVSPLQRIIKQADALGSRHFLLETKLPKILELQQVTMAMNQSVTELKKIFQNQLQHFESLRTQLFQDNLTGLGNRRYFNYHVSSLLYRDEEFVPGFIIGVEIEHVAKFKEQFGDVQAELFIKEVALLCFNFWQHYPDLNIAQIDKGRFALIIRENDERFVIKKCGDFSQKIQKLVSKRPDFPISLAVVSYQSYHEQSLLMSEFDQALANAKNEPYNLVFSPNLATHRQIAVTVEQLKEALSQKFEDLNAQPVSNGKQTLHQEISLTIPINDEIINSAYLMPMASSEGLARQLDLFLLTQVCEKELLGTQSIAFTLSEATLSNERLLESSLLQLKALTAVHRRRLNFEVDECLVIEHLARVIGFLRS